MHTLFWSEELKERDCLEVLSIDGKLILQWLSKYVLGRCGLNYLTPDTDRYHTVLNVT